METAPSDRLLATELQQRIAASGGLPFAEFMAAAASHRSALAATGHLVGVGLILVPLGLFWGRNLAEGLSQALWFFGPGMILAAVGGLLWIAPPGTVRSEDVASG